MTLTPELSETIVARLKAEERTLAAVLLSGSYARGEADAYSDIDIVAVCRAEPSAPFRAWYLPAADDRLVHVSIAAQSLQEWDDEEDEAASWALGFPAVDVMTYLWKTPRAEAVLGADPSDHLPADTPELEDFVDLCLKARRAAAAGDTVVLRWAARLLAEYGAGLLRPLNPEVVVRSPPEALRAALALSIAPAHFGEDFGVCAGLRPAPDEAVAAAASRLAQEMVGFLEPRSAELGLEDKTVEAALRDGVLGRYLAQ